MMSDPNASHDSEQDRRVRELRKLSDGPEIPPGSEDRMVARLRAEELLVARTAAGAPHAGGFEERSEHGHPAKDEESVRDGVRGAAATNRWSGPAGLAALAAAALLFLGGFLAGRSWPPPGAPGSPEAPTAPEPAEPTHALFLLGGVEDAPDEVARVEEYRTWAVDLARQGRLAAGEKLGADAWLLGGGDPSVDRQPEAHRAAPLSGFFLLIVDDAEEALAIARSCPHLRHGGEVLLRPIAPT